MMRHEYANWETEKVADHIQAAANKEGVFEASIEDFAGILNRAEVATYDPETLAVRVLAEPFATCLLKLQTLTNEAVEQRSASFDREAQPA